MIRVAHVIQGADTRAGGTTTAFFNILAAARAGSPDVDVSAYFQRPPEGDPAWKTINLAPDKYHLAATTGRKLISGELGHLVAADVRAGKMDVLHIHGLWSPDLVTATDAARRVGIPYVWQSHGMFIKWAWHYKRLKKWLFLRAGLQRCLDAADSFILMTNDELDNSVYPKSITPDRRYLIPLPTPMPPNIADRAALAREGRARFGLPEGAPTLVFMGRLHPVKRVDMTIEAFAQAARRRPDMRLLLLGKGETDEYEQSLKSLAQRLGVADKVIFAGWVLGDEKLRGLSAGTALVLNSVIESFGYVLFEAIGAGTPVLITENLSLAREFKAAGAGVVAPNSVDGLAKEMLRAIDDPETQASAIRGREWATRCFSHAAIGAQLYDVYKQAHARRRK